MFEQRRDPDRPSVLSRAQLIAHDSRHASMGALDHLLARRQRLLGQLAMQPELCLHVFREVAIAEPSTQATQPERHDHHIARTRRMAVSIRSYESRSAARRFRPALVMV